MIWGRGGMGSHKHAVSGKTSKSPQLRHTLKREAEQQERKKKRANWKTSLRELFKGK